MTNMLLRSLLVCLAGVSSVSAGERVKDPPPIQNISRTIFGNNDSDVHQFRYRGGVVNYWPSKGAQWTRNHGAESSATYAAAPKSASMPNGCLVYACARAEQIRLDRTDGETHSRVITYRRSDGSGHAFVLYKSGSSYVAEDNCGNKTAMPSFENRSAAEALFMARIFQKRTAAGISYPVQASFIGKF
jgi:hypothetical protein